MVKNSLIIILLILFSCVTVYKIELNENKEPIMKKNLYTFTKKMSFEDSKLIDTTALYIFLTPKDWGELEKSNPMIFKFHNDGFFKETSKKYFGKFDSTRQKTSVYYGGKFYLEGNIIFLEVFYPTKGSKTKYYTKDIKKGFVIEDTLFINYHGGNEKDKFLKIKYEDLFPK